ncbi:hypothetical protein K439DRAFT_437119 [Ramaria rubella]|nr:hypothetical protein K439DRAFT_437119 [Ramaria rubella]
MTPASIYASSCNCAPAEVDSTRRTSYSLAGPRAPCSPYYDDVAYPDHTGHQKRFATQYHNNGQIDTHSDVALHRNHGRPRHVQSDVNSMLPGSSPSHHLTITTHDS